MKQSGVIYPEEEFLEVSSGSSIAEVSFGKQDENNETKTEEISVINEEQSLGTMPQKSTYEVEDADEKYLVRPLKSDEKIALKKESDSVIEKEILLRSKDKFPDSKYPKVRKRTKRKSKSNSLRKRSKKSLVGLPRLRIKRPQVPRYSNRQQTGYSRNKSDKDTNLTDTSSNNYDFSDFAKNNDFENLQNMDEKDYELDKGETDLEKKNVSELEKSSDKVKGNKKESSKSQKTEGHETTRQLVTSGDIMVRIIIAAILGVFGFFYIFTHLGIFG